MAQLFDQTFLVVFVDFDESLLLKAENEYFATIDIEPQRISLKCILCYLLGQKRIILEILQLIKSADLKFLFLKIPLNSCPHKE